ncbi:MAG: 1-acyl-sn-glycerol-3-phosphate acyltransferase [Ruminococcaceae bacterium]|nr:1-acyl-sn-glycerol-3-phosphate acyltransferase [Oscillospiraceae bacterium]
MAEQIITNIDKLPFYSKAKYNYNFDRKFKDKRMIYRMLMPLAKFLLNRVFFRDVEVYGQENVPKKGGFIIAANHLHGFDPFSVLYATGGKRTLCFLAKEEFFHFFYTKYPLIFFNGFPVKRGTSDRSSINLAVRLVKEGFGLMIFPQGTRDRKFKRPTKGKSGVAMIAREAKAGVIPCSIHREKNPVKRRPKLIIRIGEMIPYEDLGFTKGEVKSRELRKATQFIMSRITELWDMDDI